MNTYGTESGVGARRWGIVSAWTVSLVFAATYVCSAGTLSTRPGVSNYTSAVDAGMWCGKALEALP